MEDLLSKFLAKEEKSNVPPSTAHVQPCTNLQQIIPAGDNLKVQGSRIESKVEGSSFEVQG